MEKKTLENLLVGYVFRIPDYQRGYAWDEDNWSDFVQDIDALIEEDIQSHYTGTIVIYKDSKKNTNNLDNYGTKKLEFVDVVDGQQRLTTCSLYLSVILKKLIKMGKEDFSQEISNYLYSGQKSKLRLNNDSSDFFYDLISKGSPNVNPSSIHQQKLYNAYNYFNNHIDQKSQSDKIQYLIDLFDAITRKLNFTFYSIEEESEIGMTFELMNSRGKSLSTLELLKNYLMHWIYRNGGNKIEKDDLTAMVNKSWKEVYINISNANGNEDYCLRIAWILYHNHSPKNWNGYDGFKNNDTIPLRDFSKKDRLKTKEFIERFVDGLAIVAKNYADIIKPTYQISEEEYVWLTKLRQIGNMANFLPLIVAARIKMSDEKFTLFEYINLLKALENSAYRVFLWEGKRSNTGLSSFYKWGSELFNNTHSVTNITSWIYGHTNWYSNENIFRESVAKPFNWYANRRLLKYSLYEHELYLLKKEGKNSSPNLTWGELTDTTIEHILPQNPEKDSEWTKTWHPNDVTNYLHDISNLTLTKNNSNYLNFDFERKRGQPGQGWCYANSDIRQERKLAEFIIWDVESCKKRHDSLAEWITSRWGNTTHYVLPTEVNEEEDNDNSVIDAF